MREVVFHRRAVKYLRRMPQDRQAEMFHALDQVAALEEVTSHPNVKALSGQLSGWYRLRVGVYRAIFKPLEEDGKEILYVDYIGTRGDAY